MLFRSAAARSGRQFPSLVAGSRVGCVYVWAQPCYSELGDFLASCRSWTADRLLRVLTSHCIFLHGGYITSALNDTPVLAERLVTGLAWKLGAWWKKLV